MPTQITAWTVTGSNQIFTVQQEAIDFESQQGYDSIDAAYLDDLNSNLTTATGTSLQIDVNLSNIDSLKPIVDDFKTQLDAFNS